MMTKQCIQCRAVVYRILIDEDGRIREIECIVCHQRSQIDIIEKQVEDKSKEHIPWWQESSSEICEYIMSDGQKCILSNGHKTWTAGNKAIYGHKGNSPVSRKVIKICERCGKEYTPRSGAQKYCCDKIDRKHSKDKMRASMSYGSLIKPCKGCGGPPLKFNEDCSACRIRIKHPYLKDHIDIIRESNLRRDKSRP